MDWCFDRGARLGAWGGLDPVPDFHRPLSDYWRVFQQDVGLRVEAFEEPGLTERGRRELPPSLMASSRIPCSCILRSVKPPA